MFSGRKATAIIQYSIQLTAQLGGVAHANCKNVEDTWWNMGGGGSKPHELSIGCIAFAE